MYTISGIVSLVPFESSQNATMNICIFYIHNYNHYYDDQITNGPLLMKTTKKGIFSFAFVAEIIHLKIRSSTSFTNYSPWIRTNNPFSRTPLRAPNPISEIYTVWKKFNSLNTQPSLYKRRFLFFERAPSPSPALGVPGGMLIGPYENKFFSSNLHALFLCIQSIQPFV